MIMMLMTLMVVSFCLVDNYALVGVHVAGPSALMHESYQQEVVD